MAAITTDRETVRLGTPVPVVVNLPVGNGETIYSGTLVTVDTDGNVISGVAGTAGLYAGVALEQVDNSAGADAAKFVDVAVAGVFLFDSDASITKADHGTLVYVSDNHTFTQTAGTNQVIGKIFQVESSTTAFVVVPGLLF